MKYSHNISSGLALFREPPNSNMCLRFTWTGSSQHTSSSHMDQQQRMTSTITGTGRHCCAPHRILTELALQLVSGQTEHARSFASLARTREHQPHGRASTEAATGARRSPAGSAHKKGKPPTTSKLRTKAAKKKLMLVRSRQHPAPALEMARALSAMSGVVAEQESPSKPLKR